MNHRLLRLVLFAVFLGFVLSLSVSAWADTIILKNGRTIYGKGMYLDHEFMEKNPKPGSTVWKLDIVTRNGTDFLRVRFKNRGWTLVKLDTVTDMTPDDKDMFEMRKKA